MITGTNYFKDVASAFKYYDCYGYERADVQQKIEFKEIKIGKPDLQPGDRLLLHVGEGRYFVQEGE